MERSDDDLATLDGLLGAELALSLDELDAFGHEIDALRADGGAAARERAALLESRRERLRSEALRELLAVRRRLAREAPPGRDERTMPLPFLS